MKEEDYIKKWLDNSLSDEEKNLFAKPKKYEVDVKMSDSLSRFKADEYDVEEQFEFLKKKRERAEKGAINRSFVWLKVAAIFIMVLGLVFYFASDFISSDVELVTSKMELTLPDATAVVLNTHSKLVYDEKEWSKQRQAFLQGEGFFEVTEGSRFDIVSTSGVVTVLGTSFSIKDRENYFEVKCFHGLVKVVASGQEFLLSKEQAYRMIDGIGEKYDPTHLHLG